MKPGDKIVCIKTNAVIVNSKTPVSLTLNKVYTIVESPLPIHDTVFLINDDNEEGEYWKERFITLQQWREQQLNEIGI